jgi:tRNA 5-methylaminomethyl-2-thiouridine biosynthesis bifunctional protein
VERLCVLGASFDIDDEDEAVRKDSHAANLQRLERMILQKTTAEPLQGRVAFRTVAPDRLPVVGRLGENVYGAFAFGSRGLIWAALAAEVVAAELEGDPAPLEGSLLEALAPERFSARAKSRGSRP